METKLHRSKLSLAIHKHPIETIDFVLFMNAHGKKEVNNITLEQFQVSAEEYPSTDFLCTSLDNELDIIINRYDIENPFSAITAAIDDRLIDLRYEVCLNVGSCNFGQSAYRVNANIFIAIKYQQSEASTVARLIRMHGKDLRQLKEDFVTFLDIVPLLSRATIANGDTVADIIDDLSCNLIGIEYQTLMGARKAWDRSVHYLL